MDLKTQNPPPAVLSAIMLFGALIALCAAIYIGIDLYRGLADGVFSLVRGKPITAADGFGYRLLVFGESLAVIAMLGCVALMLKLYLLFRSMPRDARPTNSSGDH